MPVVTLQLNGSPIAGDWATRGTGAARTSTGRVERMDYADEVVVHLAELRGVVEALEDGFDSATLAETRTGRAELGWGTPAMYHGMRFAIQLV